MVRARLNMKLAESNPNETKEHQALVEKAHYLVHEAYTALLCAEGNYGEPAVNYIELGTPEVRISRS